MSVDITVQRYRSIREIDPKLWDSVNIDRSLFKSHRFFSIIEDAKVENSIFWYLLFYEKDQIAGACALSCFTISLDLFLDKFSQTVVKSVRYIFPRFMKIRMLFCGTPLSIGKDTLLVAKSGFRDEILDCLTEEMESICSEEKINFISLKEFYEKDTEWLDRLVRYGFLKCPSLPYVSMPVCWKSFEEYLLSLRHKYRRQIRQSLHKVDFGGLILVPGFKPDQTDLPTIDYACNQTCDPDRFYEMYLSVMDRSEVTLEVLNRDFFRHIMSSMNEEIRTISCKRGDHVYGSAMLANDRDSMVFLLVGLDYDNRDKYDVYFNLIYAIIAIAIRNRVRRLDLGQTSYYIKQRIGGKCIPVYFYIKSRKTLINRLLRRFQASLFPETKVSEHNVFSRVVNK